MRSTGSRYFGCSMRDHRLSSQVPELKLYSPQGWLSTPEPGIRIYSTPMPRPSHSTPPTKALTRRCSYFWRHGIATFNSNTLPENWWSPLTSLRFVVHTTHMVMKQRSSRIAKLTLIDLESGHDRNIVSFLFPRCGEDNEDIKKVEVKLSLRACGQCEYSSISPFFPSFLFYSTLRTEYFTLTIPFLLSQPYRNICHSNLSDAKPISEKEAQPGSERCPQCRDFVHPSLRDTPPDLFFSAALVAMPIVDFHWGRRDEEIAVFFMEIIYTLGDYVPQVTSTKDSSSSPERQSIMTLCSLLECHLRVLRQRSLHRPAVVTHFVNSWRFGPLALVPKQQPSARDLAPGCTLPFLLKPKPATPMPTRHVPQLSQRSSRIEAAIGNDNPQRQMVTSMRGSACGMGWDVEDLDISLSPTQAWAGYKVFDSADGCRLPHSSFRGIKLVDVALMHELPPVQCFRERGLVVTGVATGAEVSSTVNFTFIGFALVALYSAYWWSILVMNCIHAVRSKFALQRFQRGGM
ncbi:LOW QUALITY PROTEIN: hypothetical protein CVT26_005744, partial [Gymnopilus dilepis]